MAVTKQQLIDWARRHGYVMDRWGHMVKDSSTGKKRLKLSSIAARYEVMSAAGWVRIGSNYFKNLSITPEDRLTGLVR